MDSEVNQKCSSCILCKVITLSDDEYKLNESEEEDVNFLFRILLEIPPKPGISLVVDGNLINADHLLLLKSSLVGWCDQCNIAIQRARKLYQQIKEATEKFRKVQRKIVETLQKCIQIDDTATDKDENYKAIWRKLCLHNEGRFSQFDYPFTVQNWTPSVYLPNSTNNKDTQNESSSCHGDDDDAQLACKNEDVKSEEDEDEEEVELPKQQRILLIFPEEDGDNEEDEGGSLSSGSDISDEEDKDDDEEVVIENNTNDADEDDPLADSIRKEAEPDLEFRDKDLFLKNYCEFCKKPFKSKQSLVTHKNRYHSSGPQVMKRVRSTSITSKFKCLDPKCDKAFQKFVTLRQHIKRSHPQLPIPTQRKFSTFHKKYPELYSKIVKNPETKLFTCPFSTGDGDGDTEARGPTCQMASRKKETIEIHIRSKHLGETGIYPCTWGHGCTKSFTFYENYRYHMDRHKGTPRWKCDQCDKQCYSRNSFVRHQQVEHEDGKNRKHFSCEICGKSFSCRDNLYHHKSSRCKEKAKASSNKEVKVKEGDCDICGKFVTNVKNHKKNVHPATRKHMCDLCPKRFKSAPHLKLHLKRHEDIPGASGQPKKDYQCSVKGCRLRFIRNELLESHMKNRHGEDGDKEPELKCQYCGKGFHLKKNLKHHEETHENEGKDPYECKECGKGFRTMVYLTYHQKHTHKMKLEDRRKVAKR